MAADAAPHGPWLPEGRWVDVASRGSVFVRELPGPEGAPTVVLLHGWTATADLNWHTSYEALAQHFHVIAADHRGHGRGPRPSAPFRLTDCADDAVALADALGVERFVAAGYSMGGPIALLAWRRHRARVAGLVLCATSAYFSGPFSERAMFSMLRPVEAATRVLPPALRRPLYDRMVGQRTRGMAPWVVEQILTGDPRMVVEAAAELGRFDARPWLGEIDVPVSVVCSTLDTIVPTARQRELAAAIPHARLHEVPHDHAMCVVAADRFVPALVASCLEVAADAGLLANPPSVQAEQPQPERPTPVSPGAS